jgi:hypothetical protein
LWDGRVEVVVNKYFFGFLICLFGQFGLAQTPFVPTKFFQVDPSGGYWGDFTDTPATRIELSFANGFYPGQTVGMETVGDFIAWHGGNVSYRLDIAFLDVNNNFIQAGPGTTAQEEGEFNNHSAPVPYQYKVFDFGNISKFVIPYNAVAMVLGMPTYVSSVNTDPDNNFGIRVTYSLIESADIYQVIKNPRLTANEFVDVVAGKNADIVVKTTPNADLEGSYIAWQSRSSASMTYYATSSTSNTNGELVFHIDPVQDDPAYLGGLTAVTVHLMSKNSSGVSVKGDKKVLYVTIRKTKKINFKFIRIKHRYRNKKYADPGYTLSKKIVDEGVAMFKLIYPVASSDVTVSYNQYMNIFGSGAVEYATTLDRVKIQKLFKSKETADRIELGAGIVSNEYFPFYNRPHTVAQADVNFPALTIATNAKFMAASHETAHVFCMRFDGQSGCSNLGGAVHAPSNEYNLEGYSNYDTEIIPSRPRGFLQNQMNIMYTEVSINSWFSPETYLSLFRRFLEENREQRVTSSKRLKIVGIIKQNDSFEVGNSFYDNLEQSNFDETGEYQIESTDLNGNVFSLERYSTNEILDSDHHEKILSFSIPDSTSIVFSKIFKLNKNKTRDFIANVVIPAEILRSKVEDIADTAIRKNPDEVRKKLLAEIKKYENEILAGKYASAKVILTKNIYSIIANELTNDFIPESDLDIGRTELSELALMSNRLLMYLPGQQSEILKNNFIGIESVDSHPGEAVKILNILEIQRAKKDYQLIVDIYFDGIKICSDIISKCSKIRSNNITSGNHSWAVKTFIVQENLWRNLNEGIEASMREIENLKILCKNEIDPIKKNEYTKRIDVLESRISILESQFISIKIKIDRDLILNFGA